MNISAFSATRSSDLQQEELRVFQEEKWQNTAHRVLFEDVLSFVCSYARNSINSGSAQKVETAFSSLLKYLSFQDVLLFKVPSAFDAFDACYPLEVSKIKLMRTVMNLLDDSLMQLDFVSTINLLPTLIVSYLGSARSSSRSHFCWEVLNSVLLFRPKTIPISQKNLSILKKFDKFKGWNKGCFV